MEAIEKLREVAIAAVEHVAMANYASRETEALKMIDDCVDSIRAECVVKPQTVEEGLGDELSKVISAGNKLAEAAHYLQKEYDGIHRLRLALSEWYKVRADEFGRDKNSLSL